MDVFLEILKIVLPSVVVFLAAYFTLKKVLDAQYERQLAELRNERAKDFSPMRLQAYERLVLFLERISPNNLVLRIHQKGMSARYFQLELIKAIRSEFEHNLTQQLYVSGNSWKMVVGAKEEMIKLVGIAGSGLEKDSTSEDLSQILIKNTAEVQNLPTRVAIDYLRKELRRMF